MDAPTTGCAEILEAAQLVSMSATRYIADNLKIVFMIPFLRVRKLVYGDIKSISVPY
ncbi:hypothetical protein GCM10023143_04570 [Compostibacter hankyongensis]|uniref:Uncharacterized protein n=1 Tax=Compostibacter hankyongensis TaxID=1007089 RepID=A0ABP8FEZ8_9BACT